MKTTLLLTPQDAIAYLRDYDFSIVSFDTETNSRRWFDRWCHGGSYEEGTPTGISFYNGEEAVYVDTTGWGDGEAMKFFAELGSVWRSELIIAHNIVFDLATLYKYGVKAYKNKLFDTLVAAHLLDENRTKARKNNLKVLAKDYLGVEETVSWDEARYDPLVFRNYALNDAVWAFELYEIFRDDIELEGLSNLFYKIEMPYQLCLLQMIVTGVLVDNNKVASLTRELEDKLINTHKQLLDYLGEEYEERDGVVISGLNLNSSQQLREVLFERLGLTPVEFTPTGQPSTGANTLRAYEHHEFVKLLREYKAINKLITAFFKPLPKFIDRDCRVRPEFNNVGTVTGRLSSKNPNCQQLPRNNNFGVNLRSCFVAPKGYKMVVIDFSQQETRIMAELSKDPTLIKILVDGGDIHLFSANNVFKLGIPEEKMYTTHPEYEVIKKEYGEFRNKGKVFSFGVPYGMSEFKVSKDFNISVEEGKELLENFFKGFPKLREAIINTHREAIRNGYVKTFTGRKRRFKKDAWGRLKKSDLRQAFNFLIQGFGADLLRIASIKLLKYSLKNKHMGIKQVLSVHDEIVFYVKEEYAEEARDAAIKVFESSWRMCVPLKSTAEICDNYGEAK